MSGGQSSFYWPMQLAPEPQRSAMFAIYAWCRYLDDIIDGTLPDDAKASAISLWRDYFSDTHHPADMDPESAMVAATLSAAMAAHNLPPRLFLRMLDGLEMDLAGEMRAPPLAVLESYAHAVASVPGELCLHVLGWRGETAAEFARALGEAVQYTNILRDVEEDAEQGRLYIPREALESAGIVAQDPDIVLTDARFANAWLALALMAEAKFHLAEVLLPNGAARQHIRPALAMMAIYRALWKQLRRRGWKPGAPKVSLPKWRAILIALRVAIFGNP